MTSVAITGEVFHWARERAGISAERLAKSVNTRPEKIRAWEVVSRRTVDVQSNPAMPPSALRLSTG